MASGTFPPAALPAARDRGRLCIALAALLWSTSGAFTKVLSKDTALGLNDPPISALQMACFRVLFAGLVLLPTLRRRDLSFRPLMPVMVVCFAVMNLLFVTAMALGSAANAILLQYTAPMWMYLACVFWLGEPADRRSLTAIWIGLAGVAVIVAGGWREAQLGVIALGLGSGITYAGVLVCLRVLRAADSCWLTVLNALCGGLVLLPFVILLRPPDPTPVQWGVLFLFGVLQMGLPYLLVAHGLRSVSPQEAGTITLLEPLLNPVWAFLAAGEAPSPWTLAGGAFILGALVWRYWPRKRGGVKGETAM